VRYAGKERPDSHAELVDVGYAKTVTIIIWAYA